MITISVQQLLIYILLGVAIIAVAITGTACHHHGHHHNVILPAQHRRVEVGPKHEPNKIHKYSQPGPGQPLRPVPPPRF